VTRHEAIDTVKKAVEEYDNGVITRAALDTVLTTTIDEAYNIGFSDGVHDAYDAYDANDGDADEYEVRLEDDDLDDEVDMDGRNDG